MTSFLEQMSFSEEMSLKLQSAGADVSTYIASSPLWMKLTIGGSLLVYVYIRRQWSALNNCGIDVLTPKLWTLGTMGQYFVTGRYFEWAKEELLDKDRRSVAFYRGITPTILTVDPDLIQLVFASNFNSFPHRTPGGGSIGGGHIFGHTLDIISDMPRWKRLRSTLSAGFSTKQLNEMIHAIETSIENFVNKIEKLNGDEINAKMVSGNFAADAFTTAAFSMSLTADVSIAEFDKVPFTKAMLDVLTPTAQFVIPVIVPYGGEMMDALGFSVYPKKSIAYFETFCRQILSQRKETKEGRTSDFINLMLNAHIDEKEKTSSTKGLTLDEMIAQLFVFFVAGYETTANTVTSIMYFLAKNPHYIEKLRQEAYNFAVKDMNSLTSESIPFTCAILNEALRLLPPVGVNFRVATLPNNAELELAGIKFKNGFNVEIPNDLLHTHPEFWGQNAKEFYPERWLEDESLSKAWFFQPFGGGPRNCIGMRLALMEIKLGVLKIIERFDPIVVADDVKFTRNSYTLLDTNKPLMMKFKTRN